MNSVQYKTAGICALILGCCAMTLINNSIVATLGVITVICGLLALLYGGMLDQEQDRQDDRKAKEFRDNRRYNVNSHKTLGKATIQMLDEYGNVIASEQVENVSPMKLKR